MDHKSPEALAIKRKEMQALAKSLQQLLGPTTPCICLFRDSTGGVSEVTLNTTEEERRNIGAHLMMGSEGGILETCDEHLQ